MALPVIDLTEPDAHLYLWTINRYVADAYDVARAWGFTPSTLLTW
jgi:N6-adenosine-specific RNA methylase IME4